MQVRHYYYTRLLALLFMALLTRPFYISAAGQEKRQLPEANPLSKAQRPTKLLLIAPEQFTEALVPLIAHKNKTGMSSYLLTIESIRRGFPGEDDPERMKRAIAYAEHNLGTKYICLVGDGSLLPVRHRFVRQVTNPKKNPTRWLDGTYNPSELYYANLYRDHKPSAGGIVNQGEFDNWDLNGDHKFNDMLWQPPTEPKYNPDKVDGCPDVAVGRVPAHTVQEVTTFVFKVIRYETPSPERKLHSKKCFTFVADKNNGMAMTYLDNLKKLAKQAGSDVTRLGVNYGDLEKPPEGWKAAKFKDLDMAIGSSWWVSYCGHGSTTSWCVHEAERWYDGQWVSSHLRNTVYPLVFAAACDTGEFMLNAPFGRYRDSANNPVEIVYHADKNTVEDIEHKRTISVPITVPPPSPYDFRDAWDHCMASQWLFCSDQGGAIAYFGDAGGCEADKPMRLHYEMLRMYLNGDRILGDLWLHAQQILWLEFKNSNDVFWAPRNYLGIINFFGDPSLRLE